VAASEATDPSKTEIGRLCADLHEARQQLAATTEVLTTVGRSASDSEAVLASVVESARSLIHADIAQIHLIEDPWYRLASSSGHSEEYLDFVAKHPIALDRRTLIGRVGLDRQSQQIADVLADSEYGRQDIQKVGKYRSILGVPMILGDEVVGVLSAWRTEVDPFPARAIEVLTTFAAQAAIVIRNAGLVGALKARQTELAAKVDQLEALGEIGQAVSSSLDLDQVLTKIVTHAVQLTDADGGSIFEFDEFAEEFHLRTTYGTNADTADALRVIHMKLRETLVGRAALQRKSLQIPDLRLVDCDPHLQALLEGGWISVIAVPILRDHQIIGALVIRRQSVGGFADEAGELLETFAGQSAVAILNARLFAELARKSAQLEVASRHRSEFIASMSHELRTPLTAVIGFSEVLLEQIFGEINAKQQEYLQDILSSGRHLLDLLNDILDISKVDAGRMDLELALFDVRVSIEQCIQMVREKATRKGMSINFRAGDEVGSVWADERRFRQVLLNLLSNAVKFSHTRIDITAGVEGAMLTVSVSDDGPGIALEDQSLIFEAFQQGKRPSREEGTGLGLTVSRHIVELHGGRISVASALGQGSTFTFTVPTEAVQTLSGVQPAEKPLPSGPIVVVVEDDPRSLDLLCLHVRMLGVNYVTAGDGRTGLELIRRVSPAAVILDIQLPVLDGWDLLALLKAEPSTARIPVVIVSMLDERGKGLALGAAEYLVKPVRGDDVRAALSRVTGLLASDRTLLFVGEEVEVLPLLRSALEPEGWRVLGASTDAEGRMLLREAHPAVLLLDLLGAATSGLAMVESIRSDPSTADVPIIALTSQSMTAEEKERLRGQIELVNRSADFDVSALIEIVNRATHHLVHTEDA
jgi:signal transduction histidine kinase/DNA-binding response OmpR family regulator